MYRQTRCAGVDSLFQWEGLTVQLAQIASLGLVTNKGTGLEGWSKDFDLLRKSTSVVGSTDGSHETADNLDGIFLKEGIAKVGPKGDAVGVDIETDRAEFVAGKVAEEGYDGAGCILADTELFFIVVRVETGDEAVDVNLFDIARLEATGV